MLNAIYKEQYLGIVNNFPIPFDGLVGISYLSQKHAKIIIWNKNVTLHTKHQPQETYINKTKYHLNLLKQKGSIILTKKIKVKFGI